jgi:hypothetical protein
MAARPRPTFLNLVDLGLKALIFSKFQDDMGFTDINRDSVFTKTRIALREIGERRGKVTAEFFNLWRDDGQMDWARHHTPLARRGFSSFAATDSRTSTIMVKAQPVLLNYSFTMWSLAKDKLNAVEEAYFFWMHNQPKLNLTFLAEQEFDLNLTMNFGQVRDEDTVDSQYDKGLYYTATFPIFVESWILDSEIVKTITKGYIKITDSLRYTDNRAEVLSDEKVMDFYSKDVTDDGVGTETLVKV